MTGESGKPDPRSLARKAPDPARDKRRTHERCHAACDEGLACPQDEVRVEDILLALRREEFPKLRQGKGHQGNRPENGGVRSAYGRAVPDRMADVMLK